MVQWKPLASTSWSLIAAGLHPWGSLDGLRHQRGRRHLDFAACDVGRGATNADRGHDASALARLGFDFAAAPYRDALLHRKAIGLPAKIRLRCDCPDEAGTRGACRELLFLAEAWSRHP